jgi:HSP20 family protein
VFTEFYDESRRGWVPPVDIFEDENHDVVIKAELPEMSREAIDVTFENNVLTLRGERTLDSTVKRDQYQRMERYYGSFSRSFTLPATVDAARISASYRDGVLTIRIPQREEAKPKQIAIQTE